MLVDFPFCHPLYTELNSKEGNKVAVTEMHFRLSFLHKHRKKHLNTLYISTNILFYGGLSRHPLPICFQVTQTEFV